VRRAPGAGLLLACCALALACSSGGGGNGGDSTEITSANAQQLTAEVVQGLFWSSELGSVGGSIGDGNVSLASRSSGEAIAEATAEGVARQVAGSSISAQGAFGPVTEPCQDGGTVTLSGSVANPGPSGPAAAGDQLQASFDQCGFETGELLDGLFAYTIQGLAGDLATDSFAFQLALGLTEFEIDQNGTSLIYGGTPTLVVDTRDPPFSKSTVSGGSLEIQQGTLQLILLGFTTTAADDVLNGSSGVSSLSGIGSLSSSDFTGTLSYTTVETLESTGDAFPSKGELLITGANNATIRLTVENDSELVLALDLDGDGTVDETQDTTWDELLGLS